MFKRIIKFFFGTGSRAFMALVGIAGVTAAVADYAVTVGAGTTFGSRVNGTTHYAQQLLCDMNVASASGACAAVLAGNTVTQTTTSISVAVANTLTGISLGDAVTTSTFSTGSPIYWGLFNGTTYDRPRSAGTTGSLSVTNPAADPCQWIANSSTIISLSAATATQLIAASASNKTYICSVDLFSKAGVDISIIEGTGGNCQTGTAGIIGTMSVTGISIPAQGGVVKGGAGFYVWRTNGTNVGTCINTSSSNALTGFIKYVQSP